MDQVDCVVAGAGVVGLAIARAIARMGLDVLVLEANATIGTGISSRNSEVVHAGIYYAPGSLKARLCVEGRRLLYAYCETHQVRFRRVEKFVVGTQPAHEAALGVILELARQNGVEEFDWMEAREARRAEPALQCTSALRSKQTGIVDSHGLMRALQGDLEAAGGVIAVNAPLVRGERDASGWILEVGEESPFRLRCQWLVNAAGLHAQTLARHLEGLPPAAIPALHLARGCYFSVSGRSPFSRLIYPIPVDGGLGVHVTLDLEGQARFGPDVEWINEISYVVNPQRAHEFSAQIRQYWPQLPDDALQPSFAGIRPKLSGPGEPSRDFVIDGPHQHGVPGLINLFGIESPGLTASLAIGAMAAGMVD